MPVGHVIKSQRGKGVAGTWAHWQAAMAYAKYLSHDFHLGEDSPYLKVLWHRERDGITELDFRGAPAKIFSDDYSPAMRELPIDEEIRHDLNRIRASVSPFLRSPGG